METTNVIDLSKEKLELNYPCNWKYKLVTLSKEDAEQGVKEVITQREFTLESSKASSKGKFVSFNLEILVHNDDDRVSIYELLRQHKLIKMVL